MGLHDLISLYVLKFIKKNRSKMESIKDKKDFYDYYFQEYHCWEYNHDVRAILRRKQILECINRIEMENGIELKIADIGCGMCDILNGIDSSNSLIGLDYSKNSLNLAKKYANPNIGLILGDATNLPFKSCVLDVIICCEVLEHIQNDGNALLEINRVLKSKGKLIVSVPNTYYFNEYFELMGHYRHYSKKSLEEKLNKHGFQISESLNMYPRFNFIYSYILLLLNMLNLLYGSLTKDTKNIYQRKIPTASVYIYEGILLPIFKKVCGLDKSCDDGNMLKSTFCLVEKQLNGREI
jgi:SAM-dependent methyltransferase